MADDDSRLETIREYFRRVDAADPAVVEMFTEDAQVYFPKFRVARGRAGVGQLLMTLGGYVGELRHDLEALRFTCDGDRIAVEGAERGTMHDGTSWPDGEISQGPSATSTSSRAR